MSVGDGLMEGHYYYIILGFQWPRTILRLNSPDRRRGHTKRFSALIDAKTRSVRGDVLSILFIALMILFILMMSLSYVYQQQVRQISRHADRTQAYYLALAGIDRTVTKFKQIL